MEDHGFLGGCDREGADLDVPDVVVVAVVVAVVVGGLPSRGGVMSGMALKDCLAKMHSLHEQSGCDRVTGGTALIDAATEL